MPLNRNDHITEHFQWKEFIRPQDPDPPGEVIGNLKKLCAKLEEVRAMFGAPIRITSGWRTKEHNKEVGGATNSQHLYGKAADIIVDWVPPVKVQSRLKDWPGGLGSYPT